MNIKSILLSVLAVAVMLFAVMAVKTERKANDLFAKYKKIKADKEAAEVAGYLNYMHSMKKNIETGEVSSQDFMQAYDKANQLLRSSSKTTAIPDLEWQERGPNDVGGRTRALVPDRTDSNKLYMGMVSGGFWVSNDKGNTWSKIAGNDSASRQSVTCMAQTVNGDIYYGTGESFQQFQGNLGNYGGSTMFPGNGIFKSTNGAASFVSLPSARPSSIFSTNENWSYVNKLVAHPTDANTVLAGAQRGLWRTTNGGNSWTNILGFSVRIVDVEISNDGNTILASSANNVFLSTDAGASFTALLKSSAQNNLPAIGNLNRVEVAIAPSNPNYMYILTSVPGSSEGCYKSTDKGTSWTRIAQGGTSFWDPLGSQGYYDITLGVHPTNPEMLFCGGQLDLLRYTPSKTWEPIAYWALSPQSGKYVHADMHGIQFNINSPNEMYVVTDGGFFRTADCTAPDPFFVEKNKNYSTAQCVGVAANRLGHVIFGMQDNGTKLINGSIANSQQASLDQTGGDGMRSAASDLNTKFLFASLYHGRLLRATDGGANVGSYKSFFDENIDKAQSTNSQPNGIPDEVDALGAGNARDAVWITPMKLIERADASGGKSAFFFGVHNFVWFTQGATGTKAAVWFPLMKRRVGGSNFSAITANKNGTAVYVGTKGGEVYRITGINAFDSTYVYANDTLNLFDKAEELDTSKSFPMAQNFNVELIDNRGAFITDLECDASGNTLVITIPNYGGGAKVFRSTNALSAAPSVQSIQGNLPIMPVYSAAILSGTNKYLVGTELGVWGTDNGGATWTELNNTNNSESTWHPRIATMEIALKSSVERNGEYFAGDIIYTGTHGRGTFMSTTLATKWPVSVKNTSKNSLNTISVYPNPVGEIANITYESNSEGEVSVRVYNLTGRILKNQLMRTSVGSNKLALDMSGLAKGVYMISLSSVDGMATTKIIKR